MKENAALREYLTELIGTEVFNDDNVEAGRLLLNREDARQIEDITARLLLLGCSCTDNMLSTVSKEYRIPNKGSKNEAVARINTDYEPAYFVLYQLR